MERKNRARNLYFLGLIVILFIASTLDCQAAFVNVRGWVFYHNGTPVPSGTNVNITQTATGWKGTVQTGGPEPNFYFQLGIQAADAGTDVFNVFSWRGMFNGSYSTSGLNGPSGFLEMNITYDNIEPRWNDTLPDHTINEDNLSGIPNAVYLPEYAYDYDGNISSFSIQSQSNSGLITASIDGSNYLDIAAPAANSSGVNTVCVRAYDGEDYSTTECFDITVTAVQDPPAFTAAADNVSTNYVSENTNIRVTTSAMDSDGDNVILYVCNSTAVTPAGCTETQLCSNMAASDPTCIFNAQNNDGEYTWHAFVYDTNNNPAQVNYSESYIVDATSPVAGAVTLNGGVRYSTTNNLNFNHSGFYDTGSGIYRYYYSDSDESMLGANSNWLANTTYSGSYTFSGEGNHSIYVWAGDWATHFSTAASDWCYVDLYNPSINSITVLPEDLHELYVGDVVIYALITDSASGLKTDPKMRFRTNSTSWSQWFDGTSLGGGNYTFNITIDFSLYSKEDITFEINATDNFNQTNVTTSTKYIDKFNIPPVLSFISSQEVNEDSLLSIILSATDLDVDDTVTFTASSKFTITAIDSRTANATWRPDNSEVGNYLITFMANDGIANDTQSVPIVVNPVNDAPVLQPVGDWVGYYQEPFSASFYAVDADNQNSYALDDNILVFDIISNLSWLFATTSLDPVTLNYTGNVSVTPLLSYVGRHDISVFVSDGEDSDSENITFTIGKCGDYDLGGDPWCQSPYEDCSNCPEDCGSCSSLDDQKRMAILVDPRNCVDRNFTLKTYELWKRATCDVMGDIIWGFEVCENLSNVDVIVYRLENRLWIKVDEYVSDDNGEITFVPEATGEYKLVATKSDYPTAYKYLEIGKCLEDEEEVVPEEEKPTLNETERPTETQEPIVVQTPEETTGEEQEEPASLFWQVFIFILIGFLVVALVITSYFYYEKEKNNNKYLLKARINVLKGKKKAMKYIKKYYKEFSEKMGFGKNKRK